MKFFFITLAIMGLQIFTQHVIKKEPINIKKIQWGLLCIKRKNHVK